MTAGGVEPQMALQGRVVSGFLSPCTGSQKGSHLKSDVKERHTQGVMASKRLHSRRGQERLRRRDKTKWLHSRRGQEWLRRRNKAVKDAQDLVGKIWRTVYIWGIIRSFYRELLMKT